MLKYWLWLTSMPGVSNQTRLALLRHFENPENIFYAEEADLKMVEGLKQGEIATVLEHNLNPADHILEDCQRLGQRVLTIRDAEYPVRLRSIYDPPCVLYVRGRLPAFDEEAAIAVVGTRDASPYGIACAERLSYDLASCGAVVVTGLARGGDTAAARGALRAGGVVAGVTGNGLDFIYPPENRDVYEDVAAAGALISEYPPGTESDRRHFPTRNRIMSGLSVAVLVVEAPVRSGTLITARLALEQGRDVFAVPGPINAPNSMGCIQLLEEGAGVGARAWNILREYEGKFPDKLHPSDRPRKPLPPLSPRPKPGVKSQAKAAASKEEPEAAPKALPMRTAEGLTDDQITLLRHLSDKEPAQVDDLIEACGFPARRVLSALTVMEIDSLVRQHSGKRYTRTVELVDR
ncbi:MAG: DNA-protecting protein DprA [Oscillibacter sp.]|nr:DNA-protecting protein DprA [Oscillibacter sp.]